MSDTTDTLTTLDQQAERELETLRRNRLRRFSDIRDKDGCFFDAPTLVRLVDEEADYHRAESMAAWGCPLWLIREELL